jgi:hypothetical protein
LLRVVADCSHFVFDRFHIVAGQIQFVADRFWFVSDRLLWLAFPRVSRVAWPIFWCAQVLMIFLFFARPRFASTLSILWALITIGMFLFLFASDTMLVWRGRKRAGGQ